MQVMRGSLTVDEFDLVLYNMDFLDFVIGHLEFKCPNNNNIQLVIATSIICMSFTFFFILSFLSDVLSQLENTATLTPSCELTSAAQSATTPGSVGTELSSLDLSSLFSNVSSGASTVPTGPTPQSSPASFTMDMALASSGILTIDPASVGSALGEAKPVDPLILATGGDMGVHVLDAGGGGGVLQQAALQLEEVQTVNPEALGALTALAIQSTSAADQLQALSSSSALTAETSSSSLTSSLTPSLSSSLTPPLSSSLPSSLVSSLASSTVPELLSPQVKADMGSSEAPVGPLLSGVEVLSQTENSKALTQFVFPSRGTSYNGQKETELPSVQPCAFIVSIADRGCKFVWPG